MTTPVATWQVSIKGGPGLSSFEISIVRADNYHGKVSYGWFDRNKLLVSHNGGPCQWPVNERVWNGLVSLAETVCAEMNAAEAVERGDR